MQLIRAIVHHDVIAKLAACLVEVGVPFIAVNKVSKHQMSIGSYCKKVKVRNWRNETKRWLCRNCGVCSSGS